MLPDRTIQKHQIYRHYKGCLYTILELPISTETNEVMVVYAGITGTWVRTLAAKSAGGSFPRQLRDFGAVLGDAELGYFYRFEQVQLEAEESSYAT